MFFNALVSRHMGVSLQAAFGLQLSGVSDALRTLSFSPRYHRSSRGNLKVAVVAGAEPNWPQWRQVGGGLDELLCGPIEPPKSTLNFCCSVNFFNDWSFARLLSFRG